MAMFEISSTKSKTMSHKMSIKWESEMGVLYTHTIKVIGYMQTILPAVPFSNVLSLRNQENA